MAWSIFTAGGGNGAALTWAQDFLTELGAPVTPGNEQFVYDWELSEGGGGQYNPLNQGPVPGQPQLTTSGSQYGGGAANFASYAAGIQGAVDYLNMPNYTAVKSALDQNNPTGAEAALIASPWAASHYGNGADFSQAPLPGQATSLIGNVGTVNNASGTTGTGSIEGTNFLTNLFSYSGQLSNLGDLFNGILGNKNTGTGSVGAGVQKLVERGALIVFGAVILIIGLIKMTGSGKTVSDVVTAPAAGAKAVVKKVNG